MSKEKIIAGLATLGIATAVVTPGVVCIDDNEIVFLPAEEMEIQSIKEDKPVKAGKICFKSDDDYATFKNDKINKYKSKTEKEKALYLITPEGQLLDDVINLEISKQELGSVTIPKLTQETDLLLELITELNL